MIDSPCICGESHALPDADGTLVWFLHPENHAYAMSLVDAGHPVVPCAAVPRSQVITLSAGRARAMMQTMSPAEITEDA